MSFGSLKKLFSEGKLRNIIIIIGVLGAALIFISSITPLHTEKTEDASADVSGYKEETQDALTEILGRMEGVGEVYVFLTVDSSGEGVYLQNSSTKTKEIEPVVRGVVVVCDGGDNPVTVEKVTDAVTKSLSISSAKVCVTKLEG